MPGIDAKSDAIYDLVEEGSGVEQLATGFTFTEGPIWHPVEQVLYFSDMPADIRRKVTLDGTVTEVRKPSFKCDGMVLDADLNLLVRDSPARRAPSTTKRPTPPDAVQASLELPAGRVLVEP